MRSRAGLKLAVLIAFLAAGVSYVWAEPQPIPQEIAEGIGKQIVELAEKDAQAPFKLEGDTSKANGLYEPGAGGLIIVPVKGIKDGTEVKGVEGANGAPVGYLFLHKLAPVADGKPVGDGKFPTVSFKDPEGNERHAITLRLALKKDGEKWSLLVFGKDKKPLLTAPFRAEKNGSDIPLSVAAKDISGDQGTLVVTYVGKFAADLKLVKAE